MQILDEREKTHGSYPDQAMTAQALKRVMRVTPNYSAKLEDDMRESLHLIATKISRILHGNSKEVDHWEDIAGYAMLIVKELKK